MHAKAQNVFNLYGTNLAMRAGFESVLATVESGFSLMNLVPKRPKFSLAQVGQSLISSVLSKCRCLKLLCLNGTSSDIMLGEIQKRETRLSTSREEFPCTR